MGTAAFLSAATASTCCASKVLRASSMRESESGPAARPSLDSSRATKFSCVGPGAAGPAEARARTVDPTSVSGMGSRGTDTSNEERSTCAGLHRRQVCPTLMQSHGLSLCASEARLGSERRLSFR